jgi:single-stranded-DNA-specific exonuclease
MKNYLVAEDVPEKIKENFRQYSPLTQLLLFNRGIKAVESAELFLNPDYERDMHDPFLILNMDKVVKRILGAIKNKEKIVIYGDYDCDGIPGSVILHDFFKKIGFENFENYIPHRQNEGYGLNKKAIEDFSKDGVTLLITVDLGITDIEEIDIANELSVDVIITDHHLPGKVLPRAYAILNSKQKDCKYPYEMLCGAGVAFKLVQALLAEGNFDIKAGWEKWLLDMAGLSTIADMVPLLGENRTIAYFGLRVLAKSRRPGLLNLFRKTKIEQGSITEDDISFMIAPRINAASRMSNPIEAFNLLSANESSSAGLAERLHELNNERKHVVSSIIKSVKNTLSKRDISNVIVIGNPNWRIGVLGIVASNIVEEYGKTAFVWGKDDSGNIKGSCRSDGSVNLVELMNDVENTFINTGGHKMSGGFSVLIDKVHLLEEELNKSYKKNGKEKYNKKINIDKKMDISDVTWNVYKEIEKFAPFGIDNPKPTFLFENICIANIKMFGKNKEHLQLDFLSDNSKKISALKFFTDTNFNGLELEVNKKIDLVATFDKSTFRGIPELRLRIVDIYKTS